MDKLRVNDVVIIKLVDDECFEGTIWKIGHECSYVELKNVHDHRENENIPGIQRFHRAEIESIEQIHSGHKGDALQTVPDDLNRLVEYESLKERRQLEKRILQHKIADAIVIQQCDQTYHKALDEIKAQDFVGLSLEGTNLGRLRPSSVLSFSTENNIYIFDIVTFGEIFSEIKAILQAERPIKVVFDSRYIGDNLQHLHKCKLNGVFDLMVAHFAIVKERTPITLHQCIQAYFISHIKLPDELHPNKWRDRPISDGMLHIAACNVAFLRKLHAIMTGILMKPLQHQSEIFSKSLSQNDCPVATFQSIATGNVNGYAEVDTNCLNDLNNFCISDSN